MGVFDALSKSDMTPLEGIPLFPGMSRSDLRSIIDGLEGQGFVTKYTSQNRGKVFLGLSDRGFEVLRDWIRLNNELIGVLPVIQMLPG